MSKTSYDPFVDAIRRALRDEIQRIANEETEAAVKRVIDRVGSKLDEMSLNLMSRYSVERNLHEVVIRVDKRAMIDAETAA